VEWRFETSSMEQMFSSKPKALVQAKSCVTEAVIAPDDFATVVRRSWITYRGGSLDELGKLPYSCSSAPPGP